MRGRLIRIHLGKKVFFFSFFFFPPSHAVRGTGAGDKGGTQEGV
jgi:hypothetical protein